MEHTTITLEELAKKLTKYIEYNDFLSPGESEYEDQEEMLEEFEYTIIQFFKSMSPSCALLVKG